MFLCQGGNARWLRATRYLWYFVATSVRPLPSRAVAEFAHGLRLAHVARVFWRGEQLLGATPKVVELVLHVSLCATCLLPFCDQKRLTDDECVNLSRKGHKDTLHWRGFSEGAPGTACSQAAPSPPEREHALPRE